MLISRKHRLLFVHIPKVAGISVTAALEPCITSPARRVANRVQAKLVQGAAWTLRWPLSKLKVSREFLHEYCTKRLFLRWPLNKLNVHPLHLKARDWRKLLSPAVYDSMFKFAFVRNPWDWQVSLYHYCLQDVKHPDNAVLKSMGTFERYLEWRVTRGMETQKPFVTDEDGKFIVNFVGRFENLVQDFQYVCNVMNFKNVSLPHINASAHRDYRSYYNARTRRLVEEHFHEDIATFGYSFDNDTPPAATWCQNEGPPNLITLER